MAAGCRVLSLESLGVELLMQVLHKLCMAFANVMHSFCKWCPHFLLLCMCFVRFLLCPSVPPYQINQRLYLLESVNLCIRQLEIWELSRA